jgi:asparagine synthase (glutamine-hydrolysing)
MCGIAGIAAAHGSAEERERILLRMLSVMRHRGPDENGVFIEPQVAMGNVRLSIIGISGGVQPIGNEDGTLWIVFNGEAFNYIELREELSKKGHGFTTQTDTEVVLHLYEEFGPDGLNRINGQFAIAIWDTVRQELFLARDRVGIRPLHYHCKDRELIFASEIKAIFQEPEVAREIDPAALGQIFTLWATVTPRTVFRGIKELPPGCWMRWRRGRLQIEKFWSLPLQPDNAAGAASFGSHVEELRELLKDAIRLRLRADVPVGAYLSGGLDSTIITALTSRYFNNRLKTFSIGFEDQRFDESAFQQDAVRELGTEHYAALTRNEEIRRRFPDAIWHCEKPLLRTAPVPLMLLSKAVRDHQFKVVLTGEGADEVFGGYDIFKEVLVRRFWAKQPQSRLRPLLLEKLYPDIFKNAGRTRSFLQKFYAVSKEDLADPLLSHRIRWRNSARNWSFFSDGLRHVLNGVQPAEAVLARLEPQFFAADPMSRAQQLEMDIFMSNYLLSSQGDRVAMANSVETRMPFLDYRVIEFGMRLPARWKINGLQEKYLLRKAFESEIPKSVSKRVKQPYRAPIRRVFPQTGRSDYVDDLLSESALKRSGYFNPARVAGLVQKIRGAEPASPGETQDMAFLGILSTQLVHQQFIEDFSRRAVEPIVPDKRVVKN